MPTAKTILVVDDDRDYRDLITIALEASGFQVVGAESSAQALNVLAKGKIVDAIISDLNMPGASGFDLLKVIRARSFSPAFIFLTNNFDFDQNEARRAGVEKILRKSDSLDEIMLSVRQVMGLEGTDFQAIS